MSVFNMADGYVRLKLWGNGVERFVVLCSHQKMPLWDIEAQGKYVFTNMRLKDFYNCKKHARKAGIRAVVVERHGLPFLVSSFQKRSLWMVGFLLFIAAWILSTNMLLHIKVQGNYSISEEVFRDFLEQQGIYIGMWKKDIPIEDLEKMIREHFKQVTWTSGKLDGTVLIVDIKEYDKPIINELKETEIKGSSLYATADGIISEIYVRNGVPQVKIGSEVKKGDILVDGRVPVLTEDQTVSYYQYYESDADIGIETFLEINYKLPRVYKEKNYTGRTASGKFIYLGEKIYRNKMQEHKFPYKDVTYEVTESLSFGKYSFGIGNFTTKEYVNVEKQYKEEEAKQLLLQKFEKNNRILLEKGVQILGKDVTIGIIMDDWVLSGTIKVIMPAYESRPIDIENAEEADDREGI